MSLKLYRPGPGGLEPSTAVNQDYRTRLRSRRWRLPPLRNPDAQPVTAAAAVALLGGLAALTFVVLLVGYGVGFWH
ncbi:MAG TPA: hypothetical protein VN800_03245 [Candidatus Acidoferrales bacterium]|nr:hypothetical protein [Candidatus Acidoferrales bacterium]